MFDQLDQFENFFDLLAYIDYVSKCADKEDCKLLTINNSIKDFGVLNSWKLQNVAETQFLLS